MRWALETKTVPAEGSYLLMSAVIETWVLRTFAGPE